MLPEKIGEFRQKDVGMWRRAARQVRIHAVASLRGVGRQAFEGGVVCVHMRSSREREREPRGYSWDTKTILRKGRRETGKYKE